MPKIYLLKKCAKSVLQIEMLNSIFRQVLKFNYIASAIPDKYREIIPVSGKISFPLPNSMQVYLKADGNDIVVRELYWKGIETFEGNTIGLFIKLLKFTQTFLDIGANTGLYSLIAGIDSCDRKVYAFEPVPGILPYLETNINLNQLKNVQFYAQAVTNFDGEITLYIPSDVIPTSASTTEGFRETEKALAVPALTIDSFTKMNNLAKIDLIKIDTETTEHMVLEGANFVLRRDEPLIICEVLKEGKTEKYLQAILAQLNYS